MRVTSLAHGCIVLLMIALGSGARAVASSDGMPLNTLRACIWPDYYGSTYRDPVTGQLSGVDIDMARDLAARLKLELLFVDTSPSSVSADLQSRRCDISMSALASTPERTARMRMARPHLKSDVYAVINRGSKVVETWAEIDRPGVVVGVVASSYFETDVGPRLRNARVIALPFSALEPDLRAGRIDVFMTNFSISELLVRTTSWAQSLTPSTPMLMTEYGYATALNRPTWSLRVDEFVHAIRQDGSLLRAARKHGMETMVIR